MRDFIISKAVWWSSKRHCRVRCYISHGLKWVSTKTLRLLHYLMRILHCPLWGSLDIEVIFPSHLLSRQHNVIALSILKTSVVGLEVFQQVTECDNFWEYLSFETYLVHFQTVFTEEEPTLTIYRVYRILTFLGMKVEGLTRCNEVMDMVTFAKLHGILTENSISNN